MPGIYTEMRQTAIARVMDRRFRPEVLVARVGQIVVVCDRHGRYLGAAIGPHYIIPDQPSGDTYAAWVKKRTLVRAAARGPDRRVKHGNYRGIYRRTGRA